MSDTPQQCSPADSEVTTAQIAEILTKHKVGKSDRDCDEGCCWQHYCTCGALIYPTLEDHIAGVLQASFVVVPKGQLHQETKLLGDGMGSVMTSQDGTVTSSWRPQTRMVRLVGPWRPA